MLKSQKKRCKSIKVEEITEDSQNLTDKLSQLKYKNKELKEQLAGQALLEAENEK